MGMELMARYTLSADDRPGVERGADLLRSRSPLDRIEMLLVHSDGTREAVGVSEATAGIIADLLEKASSAGQIALLGENAEISPEDAGVILGISRPLVR